MRLLVLVVALASACITSTLKTAGTHIDLADSAFERGDYAAAEREYELARQRAQGKGADWVRAKAEHGKARIGIVHLRERLPALRASATPDAGIAAVHEARVQLRELGGDAALDGELRAALAAHAERWIAEAEARARAGEVYAAAHGATPLLAVRDVPAEVVTRVLQLRAAAATASQTRAAAAGAAHPLVQRLHLGHAALLGAGEAASAAALLAPYARGVGVTIEAPSGCAIADIARALEQPGTSRRASVRVKVATCSATSDTKQSTETARWTEQVFDHYETVMVTQQKCEQVCGSVLTGGETCTTNYNTNPPSLLCQKETLTKCYDECKPVQVPEQQPRYRDEQREAPRTVTTEISAIEITGTWSVERDGVEKTGTLAIRERNEYAYAPQVGKAERMTRGTQRTAAQLATSAAESTRARLQAVLDELFARDVAAATAAARKASAKGNEADEEEAWLRAVVLGGEDLGPLAARYDLDRARLLALFEPQRFTAPAAPALPEARAFAVLARGETDLITRNDEEVLAAAMLPSFGGRRWLQFEGAYRSLPTITTPAGQLAGGDAAFLLGVRAATRALGRKESVWGWRLADELGASLALGGRTGGPEVMDNAVAGFAATFSAHYALGVGYRRPGRGAVIAGARASAEGFLIGTSSGSYAAVPLFVRAEAPTIYGTFAVEAMGASLAGSAQWGLSLHACNRRDDRDARMKYLQLRIERATVDATSTDFGDPSVTDGARMLDDVGLTSVHLLYGAGW